METHSFKGKLFNTGDIIQFTYNSGTSIMIKDLFSNDPSVGTPATSTIEAVGLGVTREHDTTKLGVLYSPPFTIDWDEERVLSFEVVQPATEAIAANLKLRRFGRGKERKPGLPLFSLTETVREDSGRTRHKWVVLVSAYKEMVVTMSVEDTSGEIIVGKATDFMRRSLTKTWPICTPQCPKQGKLGAHLGLCQNEVRMRNLMLPAERSYGREIRGLNMVERAEEEHSRRFFGEQTRISGCDIMVNCEVPPWAKSAIPDGTYGLFAGSRVIKRFYQMAPARKGLRAVLDSGTRIAENDGWILPISRDTLEADFMKVVTLIFEAAASVFEEELRFAKSTKVTQRAWTALRTMDHLPIDEIHCLWMTEDGMAQTRVLRERIYVYETAASKIEGREGAYPNMIRTFSKILPGDEDRQAEADAINASADAFLAVCRHPVGSGAPAQ
ncbi:MAG: hypothetical protein M3M85_01285 [bacterium]|nr:hypothetical protein [bacterium]